MSVYSDSANHCECPKGTHVNDIITAGGEVRHQHDSPKWLTPAEQVARVTPHLTKAQLAEILAVAQACTGIRYDWPTERKG